MVKNKKPFLTCGLMVPVLIAPTVISISCSNSKPNNLVSNAAALSKLKNFITQNANNLNSSCVSTFENDTSNINLFNVLNDPSIVSNVFEFDKNFDSLVNEPNESRYTLSFDFVYDIEDSLGNNVHPHLTSNNLEIVIPVLVTLFDNEENTQASMYLNLFTLEIVNDIVNEVENQNYNGNDGKKLVFNKNESGVITETRSFRVIPTIMIDKFLDFIQTTSNTKGWKQSPVYQNKSEELYQWRGKTLSEVRNISHAIQNPPNFSDGKYNFSYSIQNSFFSPNNRRHALFIMKASLYLNTHSTIINDAKNIFDISFEKTYVVEKSDWNFALPSKADISSYVEYNKNLLNEISSAIKSNINLYTPKPLITPYEAQDLGVKEIIKRVKKGWKYFDVPKSFKKTYFDELEKEISFKFIGVEEVSSDKNSIKINMEVCIDKNDLMAKETYSKNWNIKSGKFE